MSQFQWNIQIATIEQVQERPLSTRHNLLHVRDKWSWILGAQHIRIFGRFCNLFGESTTWIHWSMIFRNTVSICLWVEHIYIAEGPCLNGWNEQTFGGLWAWPIPRLLDVMSFWQNTYSISLSSTFMFMTSPEVSWVLGAQPSSFPVFHACRWLQQFCLGPNSFFSSAQVRH